MTKINRIIDALSVLNTDKREESISSIIKYTLYSLSDPVSFKELIEYITLEYEIDFNHEEINEIVNSLIKSGEVVFKTNQITNSTAINEEMYKKKLENNTIYDKSFTQFQNSYKSICNRDIPFDELKKLHNTFLNYVNECFYMYGKSALNFFKPYESTDEEETISRKKILNNALDTIKKVSGGHEKSFKEYIKLFPSLLTKKEEEFLERLADKTEYFFALGLPKELFEEIQNINPINLKLYLDTNVLLSILNLRKHTSNEACVKLVKLINENKDLLKISVHYTNKTYMELQQTKNELENLVEKTNIDSKLIKAGLNSGMIDAYTSCYYDEYLRFGSNAKHPIDKLKRAVEILASLGISIDRRNYSYILESEEFKDELSSYNTFQQIKNDAREEKKLPKKNEKDIFKIEHDVLIREIILEKRKSIGSESGGDLISNRYYGLTLDKILIDFDRYSLKRKYLNVDTFVPTFFSPTYLLKKLYKFLPVKSDDYRKAFIIGISSPVFEDNRTLSLNVQNTLKDFHALGINDSQFIIKCLTNEYFLNEVKSRRGDDFNSVKKFVESELQKDYLQAQKEIEGKKAILLEIEEKNRKLKSEKILSEKELLSLRQKEQSLKVDVNNLRLGIKSMKKNLERFTEAEISHSLQYNIEDKVELEKLKKEKLDLKNENEKLKQNLINSVVQDKLKKWKFFGWLSLIVGLFLLYLFLLAFINQQWEYNYISKMLDWADSLKDLRKELIKVVLITIFGSIQFLFGSMFYNRILDKINIQKKLDELRENYDSLP